jgi:hypothetical protein
MIGYAKKVWEQLRRGDISRDEQKALMNKIMGIIGGKVQDVSLIFEVAEIEQPHYLHTLFIHQNRLFSSMMLLVLFKPVLRRVMPNKEFKSLRNLKANMLNSPSLCTVNLLLPKLLNTGKQRT